MLFSSQHLRELTGWYVYHVFTLVIKNSKKKAYRYLVLISLSFWLQDSLKTQDASVENAVTSVQALSFIYHMYKSLQVGFRAILRHGWLVGGW